MVAVRFLFRWPFVTQGAEEFSIRAPFELTTDAGCRMQHILHAAAKGVSEWQYYVLHNRSDAMKSQSQGQDFDWKLEFVAWISGVVLILSIMLCAQLSCWLENRRDRTRAAVHRRDNLKATWIRSTIWWRCLKSGCYGRISYTAA